ncbi:TatD family hydrolase [Microbulbifer spongiae]|uniref:TatD family hydrolase n=1 Tax=Microbulbifer spongiae TaxID=2944933 RepID=A0ABY9EHL8_9GAMM|nr:TatD family hydrolase [Microbulbifer sp. MI-G]WKD51020.1 TatD family hydrolase [Microbulbifer sp. MI-G]
MKLIDSHCHFDFDAFAPDRSRVWQRCLAAGVSRMIIPGVCEAQWQPLADLVKGQPGWYAAAGIHPWWVGRIEDLTVSAEGLDQLGHALTSHVREYACVAVGECGLDTAIDTPLAQQEAVFRLQIEVACALQLPLVLHVHRTHNAVLRLLKHYRPPRGGVVHAFSGSEQMAGDYWQLGFYLGVGGTVTYPRAAKTRRTFSRVPLQSLLLESDAPDMPLSGRQGRRNSPEHLPLIAAELAELRGVSTDEIANTTRHNTEMLFSL